VFCQFNRFFEDYLKSKRF